MLARHSTLNMEQKLILDCISEVQSLLCVDLQSSIYLSRLPCSQATNILRDIEQEWVIEKLLPALAFVRAEAQARVHEVQARGSDLRMLGYGVDSICNVLLQLVERLTDERVLSSDDLVQDCTK